MILVFGGGGARGFYQVGVLRALEELDKADDIKAIYGVSIGAVVGAFWAAGHRAEQIYDELININIFKLYKPNFFGDKSMLKTDLIKKLFEKNLPEKFEDLQKKLYIGATDAKAVEFMIFRHGELLAPLMGSMGIPGIYPAVHYKAKILIDGGVLNNFPADEARAKYPNEKILGVALNNLKNSFKGDNRWDIMSRALEIVMQSSVQRNKDKIDHLLYPELEVAVLDYRKALMKKAYKKGYEDCKNLFAQNQDLANKH